MCVVLFISDQRDHFRGKTFEWSIVFNLADKDVKGTKTLKLSSYISFFAFHYFFIMHMSRK